MARQRTNKAGAHQWREEQALAGRAGPALSGRLHGVQGRRRGSRGGCTRGGYFRGEGRLLEGPGAAAPGAAELVQGSARVPQAPRLATGGSAQARRGRVGGRVGPRQRQGEAASAAVESSARAAKRYARQEKAARGLRGGARA
ncbi:unnamed protein product [Closterium sp. NIES-53]